MDLKDLLKAYTFCPDRSGLVGWVSSCKAKGCGVDSWSEHMPEGLWVWSPVGAQWERQLMFLTHCYFSLSLPPFPSL